jgi:hypothetical protein
MIDKYMAATSNNYYDHDQYTTTTTTTTTTSPSIELNENQLASRSVPGSRRNSSDEKK